MRKARDAFVSFGILCLLPELLDLFDPNGDLICGDLDFRTLFFFFLLDYFGKVGFFVTLARNYSGKEIK